MLGFGAIAQVALASIPVTSTPTPPPLVQVDTVIWAGVHIKRDDAVRNIENPWWTNIPPATVVPPPLSPNFLATEDNNNLETELEVLIVLET